MIPNTKISLTILEFGKSLVSALPEDHTKEEFENVIQIVITAWNAVVMDSWDKEATYEADLLALMENEPKVAKIEMKRLLKRKKTKFSNDPRGVGDFWVREDSDGEFMFGCQAHLNVENSPASNTQH
jgi:hypothetical protein